MKLLNFLQTKGLYLIMILFFMISLVGLFHDFSLNTGGDESVLMAASLKMISEPTLRPNFPTFYHLPLAAYFYLLPFIFLFSLLLLFGVFTDLASLKEFALLNLYNFLPFARFLTVLMGLVSICLLYKISQKLFYSKWISLLAAFFLSFSLMFVELAHLARVWMPQTMAVLLAFWFIIILYERPGHNYKDYLLAGLSIGLAFGVHAIGVIVYFSFLAAHYLKSESKKMKDVFLTNKYFWLVNAIFAACYFLIYFLNPYGFNNYINRNGKIWPNFSFLFEPGATPNVSADNSLFFNVITSLKNLGYFANILAQWETILVLLFLAGAILLFLKQREKFYLIMSFVLVYYLGATFSGLIWYYFLPAIPFLALLAGYSLFHLWQAVKGKNKLIAFASLFIILSWHLAPALAWDYLLIQPSGRILARDWIYNNVSSGSAIINFDTLLELNENQLSLADKKKYAANFYTRKQDFLLSQPEGKYPRPNYYVLYADYFHQFPEELINKKYDYLIIGWNNKKELAAKLNRASSLKINAILLKRFPEAANENKNYQDIRDLKRPINYFLTVGNITAPVIDIYKIK